MARLRAPACCIDHVKEQLPTDNLLSPTTFTVFPITDQIRKNLESRVNKVAILFDMRGFCFNPPMHETEKLLKLLPDVVSNTSFI